MSRRRCGTRTDGYPPVTRRQRRRRALPASRRRRPGERRTALRAPPRVGRGSVRQRRHQRPATTGTPFAPPLADVPPSAALGAHLDHRTSLAPATTRAAARGAVRSRAIQPRSGDDARCGTRRGEEPGQSNRAPATTRAAARGAVRNCAVGPATPTVAYGYPQFPQVYPQRALGYARHQHCLCRLTWVAVWISAGWYRRAIYTPDRYASEMTCLTNYPQTSPAVRHTRTRAGHPFPVRSCTALPPRIRAVERSYAACFQPRRKRLLSRSRNLSCDSPHSSEVKVQVKGD